MERRQIFVPLNFHPGRFLCIADLATIMLHVLEDTVNQASGDMGMCANTFLTGQDGGEVQKKDNPLVQWDVLTRPRELLRNASVSFYWFEGFHNSFFIFK